VNAHAEAGSRRRPERRATKASAASTSPIVPAHRGSRYRMMGRARKRHDDDSNPSLME
jgi:hypothetical protein